MDKSFYELVFGRNSGQDKFAVMDGKVKSTYKELKKEVDEFADNLLKQNHEEYGQRAVVNMSRSINYVIVILALSKLGITFVPVDVTYPAERLQYIIEDCQADIIIQDKEVPLENKGNIYGLDLIDVSVRNKQVGNSRNEIAYIIYTSGSTGLPKGVQISNKGFSYLLSVFESKLGLTSNDRILQFASISFDASIWEISMALLSGLTLVIWGDESKDTVKLENLVDNYGITIATLPPSFAEKLDSRLIDKLSLLITAGSEPHSQLLRKINLENTRYINAYGPTECTVCASVWEAEKAGDLEKNKIPIGNINQDNLMIRDGELYVSGESLAIGYLNREQLNNQSFSFYGGTRFFKTGDLVDLNDDGSFCFRGRKDNQIKFNGYRIELEEIERNIYDNAPGINELVVKVEKDSLICFYSGQVDVNGLKKSLGRKLPHYMIPSVFQKVLKFEKNTSGKIDKSQLKLMEGTTNYLMSAINPEFKVLEQILKDILPVAVENREENLMEYGLNSIGMINLSSKLKKNFGLEISIDEIANNCSFEKIARIIKEKGTISTDENEGIVHDFENENEWFPLTNIQSSYLLGRNSYSEMGGYGTHGYFEIQTELDVEKLALSLNTVISSQGMLRAVFSEELQQRILPPGLQYHLEITDMSSVDMSEVDREILKRRDRLSHQTFDYTKWPLFDISALKVSDNAAILFISIDGLLADARSMQIFAQQWLAAYNGADIRNLSPRISFRDYIVQLKRDDGSKEKARDYWLKRMEKMPKSPSIVDDAAIASLKTFARESFTLDAGKWNAIKKICHDSSITPTTFFIQVYFETLSKWSQNKQFALNLSVFNRKDVHSDINSVIGDFTSNIFIDNLDQDNQQNFFQKSQIFQKQLFSSLDNIAFDGVDFLREYANKYKRKLIVPYVVTSLISEGVTKQAADYFGKMTYGISQTPQVYIDMQISNQDEGILINWDYSMGKFTKRFMERLVEVYKETIYSLLKGEYDVSPILPASDNSIINSYNDTDLKIENCRLETLLFNAAKRYPNNISIKDSKNSYSYSELVERVIKRASDIVQKTGSKGKRIGLVDNRNFETIVDMLAILYSGNTYVPFEADYPEERISYIQKAADIEYMNYEIEEYPNQLSNIENTDLDQVAYVIFTSGSTGKPKGVEISHRSVVNTILDINKRFGISSSDRFMLLSSLNFDLSVFDVFGAISVGASCYIVNERRDVQEIRDIVSQEKITIWNSVPSTMKAYLNSNQEMVPNMGKIKKQNNGWKELDKYIDEKIVLDRKLSEFYKQESLNRFSISSYQEKVELPEKEQYPKFILDRKSTRKFNNAQKITKEKFFNIISSLGIVRRNETNNHFLYPSAGGLYPIDIYISVGREKIEGVAQGIYYYNPVNNSLYKLSSESVGEDGHLYTNKNIVAGSSFTIFFIYNSLANVKKYGEAGYKYALIDSGFVGQHVTTLGNINGISSCIIGAVEESKIIKMLELSEHQSFLHCIIFGCENQQKIEEIKQESSYLLNNSLPNQQNLLGKSIRVIMLSGDYIPIDLPDKIFNYFGERVSLYSLGGATECSIWSIYYPIWKVNASWKTIPYGYPLGNQKVWIMDSNLNICPIGVIGEIVIGGIGVGEGYITNSNATTAAFVTHPKFGKIYQTGDFGVLRENGEVEFLGRMDNQIKVNGYRVEIPEIEKVIRENCQVTDVAILTTNDSGNQEKIVCFIQNEAPLDNLHDYIIKNIKDKLPMYMLPQEIYKVKEIPVTANGKIDKKELLVQRKKYNEKVHSVKHGKTLSVSSIEQNAKLHKIFSEVLETEDFSDDKTIFDLGGDSINIVSIHKKVEEQFNISLKIIDVFENNTVNKLSKFLSSREKTKISGVKLPPMFLANKAGFNHEEKVMHTEKITLSNVLIAVVLVFVSGMTGKNFQVVYNDDSCSLSELKLLSFSKEILDVDEEELEDLFTNLINETPKIPLENVEVDNSGTSLILTNKNDFHVSTGTGIVFYIDSNASRVRVEYNSRYLDKDRMSILISNVKRVVEKLVKKDGGKQI